MYTTYTLPYAYTHPYRYTRIHMYTPQSIEAVEYDDCISAVE